MQEPITGTKLEIVHEQSIVEECQGVKDIKVSLAKSVNTASAGETRQPTCFATVKASRMSSVNLFFSLTRSDPVSLSQVDGADVVGAEDSSDTVEAGAAEVA